MWIKNYKQAFMYLINHKTYSLVVIIGLAVGIAASFLIYSYVFYEKSFDNFHQHGDNLYRVSVTCQSEGQDPYKSPYSYAPQGMVAVDEIPEVENYVRLKAGSKVVITSIGNETVKMLTESNYYYADEAFFELFSFPLIYGTPKNVLKDPGTVVLSQSMADKLFGTQNPVGREIKIDGKYSWRITGVFEDIPENTHLKFNMLFSLNTLSWIMNVRNAWSNHSFFTYFLLKEGADQKQVESKITKAYLKENRAINQSECSWELQAITDAYLDTNDFTSKPKAFKFGNKRVVYFLSLIAILILCIAWVNYINLSSAKEADREKEILVRKTFGAGKFQLILQFFLESILYNFISVLVAIGIVALVFNWFISTMSFSFLLWSNTGFWITIGSILAIGVLLSACLTSISMSRLDPLKSDNSVNKSNSKSNFRNGLVIFQLVVIILLIVGVGFVNKQLTYLHSVDLGFQKEQVLVLNAPRENYSDNNINIFREELKRHSDLVDVTASVSIPGERFGNGNGGPSINGQTNTDKYFRVGRIMPNYLNFYEIKLASGRDFEDSMESNEHSIIINEEAAKEFGFEKAEDAIQKTAIWQEREVTIIGVTKSFHQQSLHIKPEPMIMYTFQFETDINYILVKLNTNDFGKTIASIEKEYKAMFPNNPFDYFFLDRFFDQQYKTEIAFQNLFSFFSIIALLIGIFGIHGLITFMIIKRTKEIGIRKVNGATVFEIMRMLNISFVKWVGIAFVIATPIAYYSMNKWIESFAYKAELSWWVFALAGLFSLIIVLFTVSGLTYRAARRNPVEALRYE